ncbi:MAG: hypothetical protein AAF693_09565 [Bacteroidota bacterium]
MMIADHIFKSFRSETEESLPQRKTAIPFLLGKDVFTLLRHDLLIVVNQFHLKCTDIILPLPGSVSPQTISLSRSVETQTLGEKEDKNTIEIRIKRDSNPILNKKI